VSLYEPYWTPAAVVFGLLILVIVPYLSLIALMVALLAAAAAVVAVATRLIAATPHLVHRSILGRRSASESAIQLGASPPAATHDWERSG
jgi:hypothetical protein